MLTLRPARERGHSQLDWLDSWHTFSFDQYFDPAHMAFGPLRVINEDIIAPGGGFGMHRHHDMEIVTYVISGKLEHQDSLGNGSVIAPGEIQKMSAGTGIKHSEFNASKDEPVHLLQIWIVPDTKGLQPAYEQKSFQLTPGQWHLLASYDQQGLVHVSQKARLYALSARENEPTTFTPASGTHLWLQIVKGAANVESTRVSAGDGLAIQADQPITIHPLAPTEILLFELHS